MGSDTQRQLERQRVQAHLSRVERHLLAVDSTRSPAQAARRHQQLQRLHEYWLRGKFPQNQTHPHQQTPCFIDAEGHICAVAHLLIADGCSALALNLAEYANFAYVREMAFPELHAWVAESGLSVPELALIQPSYQYVACPSFPNGSFNPPPSLVRPSDRPVPQVPKVSTKIKFIPVSLPANASKQVLDQSPQCSVALVLPVEAQNVTMSAHPTFLVYLDEPLTLVCSDWQECGFDRHELQAMFSLQDAAGKVLYSRSLTLPTIHTPSIVRLNLPETVDVPPLQVGRQYRWKLTILKEEFNQEAEAVEGVIQRISLEASLMQQLTAAAPREKLALYAKHGLWYDMLDLLATLRQDQPEDPELAAVWEQSIQLTGDRRAANALLVNPSEALWGKLTAFLTDPEIWIMAVLLLLVGGTGWLLWFWLRSICKTRRNPDRTIK